MKTNQHPCTTPTIIPILNRLNNHTNIARGISYRSSSYMKKYCPVSCRDMPVSRHRMDCKDAHPKCTEWARIGECQNNNDMKKFCPLSCETCTNNEPREMTVDSTHEDDDDSCVDHHELCLGWAVRSTLIEYCDAF
jgi:hypothetical protein